MDVGKEALDNFKRIFAYNVLEKCITVYREKYNSLQAEIKNAEKYIEYSKDEYVSIYKLNNVLQLKELTKDGLKAKVVTDLKRKLDLVYKLHGFLDKISAAYGPSVILTTINDMVEYIEREYKIAIVRDNTGYNIKF